MENDRKELKEITELTEVFYKKERNVYLYGAGRYTKVVLRLLADNNFSVNSILVSTASNNPSSLYGIPVEEYVNNTGIIIVCMNESMHDEISCTLSKNDNADVYYISDKLYNLILYRIHDFGIDVDDRTRRIDNKLDCLSESYYNRIKEGFLRFQPHPELRYFILNIDDHCNLNCKGCNHFSSIAEKRYVEPERIKSDLTRMHEVHGEIPSIGIMGGEPLLHPSLIEILKITRSIFKHSTLLLSTNGTLCKSMNQEFWDACKEYDITIRLSIYPIEIDYMELREWIRLKGIKAEFFGDFEKSIFQSIAIDPQGRQDAKNCFFECDYANKCILLSEGKLYTCQVIPNIQHLCKKFNLEINVSEEDYIDIYTHDKKTTLDILSQPVPFCRYCNVNKRLQTYFEWGITNPNSIEEWI